MWLSCKRRVSLTGQSMNDSMICVHWPSQKLTNHRAVFLRSHLNNLRIGHSSIKPFAGSMKAGAGVSTLTKLTPSPRTTPCQSTCDGVLWGAELWELPLPVACNGQLTS